uniref:Chitin-binding type-2 domain-containing protein n=1 Tax=Panagrolaimus sp. PS1159 TaxID=55785 RepID=A0AC35GUK7_9BILA
MQNFKEGIFLLFWLFLSVNGIALKLDSALLADDDDNSTIIRNLRSFQKGDNNRNDDPLTIVSIGYYCKSGQSHSIALGTCSSLYIQCSNAGIYTIEECPLEKVFNGQSCIEASTIRECFDPRLNVLNLATENLASSIGACNNGPGIQFSPKNHCSRQALFCDSSLEPHAISCSSNQILDFDTLQCIPSKCPWGPQNKIKDSLIQNYCQYRPGTKKCQNWFIWCNDGLFGFCDGQQIFDETINGCRPSLPQERCEPLNVCNGWEWKAVELGECSQQFQYCEGLKPITFTCREGYVFQGKTCIPFESAKGCSECKIGETKPAKHCKQFYECEKYGTKWSLKTCPTNEIYNQKNRRCELNYGNSCADFHQTCQNGDSYNPSCGDYFLCREGQFHPGKCPHLTRWSKRQLQCIPDNTCRRYENNNVCRRGDIIPTVDCETYFSCDPIKGQFVRSSCKDTIYGKNPACEYCIGEKPTKPAYSSNPSSPPAPYTSVKCINGEKIIDKVDCSRYISCINGEWYSLQCEGNTIFDSNSGLCIYQSKSRCPRNGSHLDSFHQPQDSGFGENDNSAFPPPSPPFIPIQKPLPSPPPPMDETRREMYEQSNGFIICLSHKSPQFVADPRDCGSYLECQNGFYQPRTCPQGHNFDAFTGRCSSTFKCDRICQENERIPRKECGKALECQNNAWVPMKCKENTMFINGRCSEILCPEDGNPSSSTCYEGAVYSNERDCTRYVICRNGQLIEKQCSNGQKFNAETLSCSYKYDCSSESSPKCYIGERRAIHDSCSHFEECQYGTFVKVSCPYGKNFNSITKKCQHGPCRGSGSQIGDVCTESAGLDGFLPDPLECRRFYQCANGRWVPKDCAAGTAFSPQLGVCDHIRNVPACARS